MAENSAVNVDEECPECDDYDSPWKEAIRDFFEPFMSFFFSRAHTEIDWAREPEFLDKELQQITRDAELGNRVADLLIKVWLKSGEERWVVVHVEVQGQRQPNFTERMYIYNFRTYDRHRVRVASLAIVTDESHEPCPDTFEYEVFGCKVGFTFPVAILGTFRARRHELEQSDNPFSIFVQAHLDTQDTKGDDEARFLAWRRLLKTIPKRGHSEEVFGKLLDILDWLMRLPKSFDPRIVTATQEVKEEYKMPLVSRYSRIMREEGRVEGRVELGRNAIIDVLSEEVGLVPSTLIERINAISDESKLRILLKAATHVKSCAEFEAKLDHLN